ncbi:MAG: Maf family protein [Candidatus Eiseniibacteriota bacterium]
MSASLVLASASPRRFALLREAGIECEIHPAGLDEDALHTDLVSPSARAVALALAKARTVAALRTDTRVLGADTVVVLDQEILGKPKDAEHALWMLSRLSGRAHEVITGVALIEPESPVRTAFEATAVYFVRWPASAMIGYARSSDPLDKAGAYGLQGFAGRFVSRIEGDPANVIGLPVNVVRQLLNR